MEYIEVTGRTIEDALTNACLKLETTSDNIEYEVIEKGSNGLFGIFNSKPTKIKARVSKCDIYCPTCNFNIFHCFALTI